tara:strand:+ start:520 stop:807 length:288 start_codon:yes stop_codon:yes gene_type:complete
MKKINLDGIHLDMDTLIEKYNGKMHSVSDSKEIQQISLFCQNNITDYRKPVLMDMINPMLSFAALYPHIMTNLDYNPGKGDRSFNSIKQGTDENI